MARVWSTGFELGNPGHDLTTFVGTAVNGGTQPGGVWYIRGAANGTIWTKTIAGLSEFYFATHCRFNHTGDYNDNPRPLVWRNGATVLGSIGIDASTFLWTAYVGSTAVATSVAPNAHAAAVWSRLDIYVKLADSGGRICLWVDGLLVIDYTGDTKPGADATADVLAGNGYWTNAIDWDNVMLNDTSGAVDNGRVGEGRIIALRPTAAGTYTQWTPSAGANYAAVDEAPSDDDTTYVGTGTNGLKDTYLVGASGLVNVDIKRVWVELTAKESAAGVNQISPILISGASENVDTAQDLSSSYASVMGPAYTTDPNTAGDPWTVAAVDALEVGAQAVI